MVIISKAVLKEFSEKIFKVRTVFILFIGTHKEYDKIDAAKVEFKK